MAQDNAPGDKTVDAKPTFLVEIRDNGKDGGADCPLGIKVKPSTQIYKVVQAWCKQYAHDINDWVFIFDGEQILLKDDENRPTKQTIAELEIEEDVMIEALRHQIGGGCSLA